MTREEILTRPPAQKTVWDFSVAPDTKPVAGVTLLLARPWILRLRFVLYGLTAVMLLSAEAADFLSSPLPWGLALLGLLAGTNWAAGLLSAAHWERHSANVASVLLVLDTLGLTVVLGLAGGFINPLTALLLVPVMLAAIALPGGMHGPSSRSRVSGTPLFFDIIRPCGCRRPTSTTARSSGTLAACGSPLWSPHPWSLCSLAS